LCQPKTEGGTGIRKFTNYVYSSMNEVGLEAVCFKISMGKLDEENLSEKYSLSLSYFITLGF